MDNQRRSSVLITGGRGFIGRSVGKLLRRQRYGVLPVDTVTASQGTDEIACDVTDIGTLRNVFQREQVEAIIHLAAILPTAAQCDPLLATRVNVQGSLNLLELAREFHVRRFIFASSLSVYGTCGPERVVTEADRATPEDLYSAAKFYVEQLGAAYRQADRLEFVSLRIGRVVGPGARSMTSAWRSEIFEQLGSGSAANIEIPYRESERILLVHVEDVAKMLLGFLEAPRFVHDVYNAACESVTVGELKSALERYRPQVQVRIKGQEVVGNPRRVDWSRYAREFGFETAPIFEQLARAAGRGAITDD